MALTNYPSPFIPITRVRAKILSDPNIAHQKNLENERKRKISHDAAMKLANEERYKEFTELQKGWYEGLGPKFRQGLRQQIGFGMSGQLRGLEQTMGRRGLTGSGLEYAGEAALRAGAEQSYIGGVADFETAMAQQMGQERSQFVSAEFDFFRELYKMDYNQTLQKQLLQFQYQLAQKYDSSGWEKFFGAVAELGGTLGAAYLMAPVAPVAAATGGTFAGSHLGMI